MPRPTSPAQHTMYRRLDDHSASPHPEVTPLSRFPLRPVQPLALSATSAASRPPSAWPGRNLDRPFPFDSVSVLDLRQAPPEVALKQIVVRRFPEGIDLAPDGSALWVAGIASRTEEARISVIDPKSDSVVRTIPTTTKLANRLKFTPDGTHVAVSDPGTNEISIFDAATGNVIKTIPTAAGPAGILFTPHGKRLFVACADAGKVQMIDTATWSIAGEVATGTEPDGMAYARK